MLTLNEIKNGIGAVPVGTPIRSIVNPDGSHTLLFYVEPSPVGSALDSFGRQRVSNPQGIFDSQFTYGLQPLLYEQLTNGAGASIVHDATNRAALMQFTTVVNGSYTIMQSFEHLRYQAGKSQRAFITFNHHGMSQNVEKFARYGDDDNAVEYVLTENEPEMRLLSDTDLGDQTAVQSGWNIDRLDGTGDEETNPSGILFDPEMVQIFLLDLQALYTGRVRVGFDIDGAVIYVHEFNHANRVVYPYIQSANLPIACGMRATGDDAVGSMRFICSSASSEGGQDESAGDEFSTTVNITAGNNVQTHALTLIPKQTFNTFVNRAHFYLKSLEISVLGNNAVRWQLRVGQALTTPTFVDVNPTYSAMQVDFTGTLNGDPAIIANQGTVPGTATSKLATAKLLTTRYPITLDAAGNQRTLGSITITAAGVGATSSVDVTATWKEIK